MTSAKSLCSQLMLGVMASLCFTGGAHAQGLTEENIREFYDEMVVINTTLREGQEDLPQLIDYLDRTLTDDFHSKSNFKWACKPMPDKASQITKQEIIDIYNGIGVNNYDIYELEVVEMTIAEEQDTAQVQYSLHVEDVTDGNPFMNDIIGHASLIWDEDMQAPRVVSQVLDQIFTIGTEKKDCETPE